MSGLWAVLAIAIVAAIPVAGAIIMLSMRLQRVDKVLQDSRWADQPETIRAIMGEQPSRVTHEAQTQPARNGWRELFSR